MANFFEILLRLAFKYQASDREEGHLEIVNEEKARTLLVMLMDALVSASQVQGLHVSDAITALAERVRAETRHPEYQLPGGAVTVALLEAAAREAELRELP